MDGFNSFVSLNVLMHGVVLVCNYILSGWLTDHTCNRTTQIQHSTRHSTRKVVFFVNKLGKTITAPPFYHSKKQFELTFFCAKFMCLKRNIYWLCSSTFRFKLFCTLVTWHSLKEGHPQNRKKKKRKKSCLRD